MTYNPEQPRSTIVEHWHATGEYLFSALREIATERGGEDYADAIATIASQSASALPNPTALSQLDRDYPGSAATVFERAEELQRDAHRREFDELQRTRVRRVASAIATSLGHLSPFVR